MKKIGLLLFLRYSLALCPHKIGFPSLSEIPIGMLRSICRISVGASVWNTIFRQNRSMNYYRRCGRDWGHVGLALEIA